MTQRRSMRAGIAALAALAAAVAGCGGSNLVIGATPTVTGTGTATATVTPTRTPTPPSVAVVGGLIVVNQDVGGDTRDGLMPLPPESLPAVGKGFDRGLGNADWTVDDGGTHGQTTADGHFSISGLAPGPHTLHVTKTVDGNLLDLLLPIVVGDDGSAQVVGEVSWGLVRSTSTYTLGGAAMRAVFAPNGTHLITRGDRAVELGDTWRTLVDADGDGRFDPQSNGCDTPYQCDEAGGCDDTDHVCVCVASCPSCEDCPARACVARASLMQPGCGPDGLCKALPYACGANGSCARPDEQCACIASCPACDDCNGSACVVPCAAPQPVEIVAVSVDGPTRLVVGRDGNASASAALSDGTAIDVTWLATWTSSQPEVAGVDGWGHIAALSVGATDVTAAMAAVTSAPLALEVVERPTLRHIYVQNASCYYPLAGRDDTGPVGPLPPTPSGDILPPPSCQQVVRIGATLQFIAVGEFDTGDYEDITGEVEWRVAPVDVGDVVKGMFTARQAGSASLSAALDGVESDALTVTVVSQPTLVALSVYPVDWAYQYIDGGPVPGGAAAPCFECGYLLTLLRGDSARFAATAHYDTGEWEDVTSRVTWHSGDAAVASIDPSGVLTAEGAGDAAIDAALGDVTSAPVSVHVVNEATLQSLYAYQDGQDHVVGRGDQLVFHAVGYYDVGFDRDVTAQATWHSSDETVGGFDQPGTFTGRAAGTVSVWAELDGQQSAPLTVEVFATSELAYCDPANVNRGVWSDDFDRVTLESDCAEYTPPGVVQLRFSVTETQRPGGVFDPCLDLYAFAGDTLVRTIREEGCGDPFVAPSAPGRDEAVLKYQLSAFWDLKDERGEIVPPGTYTINGRFYLYFDPVVKLVVRVNEAKPPS